MSNGERFEQLREKTVCRWSYTVKQQSTAYLLTFFAPRDTVPRDRANLIYDLIRYLIERKLRCESVYSECNRARLWFISLNPNTLV